MIWVRVGLAGIGSSQLPQDIGRILDVVEVISDQAQHSRKLVQGVDSGRAIYPQERPVDVLQLVRWVVDQPPNERETSIWFEVRDLLEQPHYVDPSHNSR